MFQEFLNKYERRILSNARQELWRMKCTDPQSHAEDVASVVKIKVWWNWHKLFTPERVIYKIISNAARDHVKKCLAQVPDEIPETATPSFSKAILDPKDIEAEANARLRKLLCEKLMSVLEPDEMEVIVLTYYYDYSSAEIGKIMHKSANTIRWLRACALEKMRKSTGGPFPNGESAV